MADDAQHAPTLHGDPPAAASPQGLADRNALAAVAVERTRMPMVVSDPRQPDNPIVLANRAFLELTGYSADEVIGRNCRFLQGEGTSAETIDAIRTAMLEERDFEAEILNYRKDGSAFWNRLNLSPVHDEAGQLLYVFGSQIDVTELRKVQELEASEHRLLKEVDHRALNVLAVVGGIVRLSRSDEPVRYARAIQQRVAVLANAHTLLAERGWQEVSLEHIIRQQMNGPRLEQVALSGPELMVSAIAVQPLALVIHELVDNAQNHGALSVPGGRVEVSWDRGSEYGAFELIWREFGGPTPPLAPQIGFGTAMIAGMIERQLRGRIDRDWVDHGLCIKLTAPGTFEPAPA
ncbi:PAS domain-containing protein [Phenylobacterium sp.]|uniref:blue-light-activated histidine kinase n=1 Tax=Phenylobacterium sp. TaxID=1871053 RepID=UPI0027303388|nr:PAS domain-containing protein [Phenylobacterium sp.]MDP2212781.1 PAS domain-containing protein [Phenylobacterium sp.]